MSGEPRRTVGEGLAAHVGDRLSRRWAVSTSGRSGTYERLGLADPWSGGQVGATGDARARREARLEERLGRYDRALGLRAAMRRQSAAGGARVGAFGGFDVSGLVFPRMIQDAPAAVAEAAAEAAPARSRRAYVPARVSSAPWLSPSGAPARVRRGQPSRSAAPELEGAAEPAAELAAPVPRALDRVLSRAAPAAPAVTAALSAGLRQTPARASARRVAAARSPEAVARAALGPAARLFEAELSADQADVALRPSALAQARTQAVGGAPARGLRPVLVRSPMAQAMVVAQAPAPPEADAVEVEPAARAGVQPMAARLSASPVRRSARPAPRVPAARREGAARAALGVAARSAQRAAADAGDAAAAPAARAPQAAPAPLLHVGPVERLEAAPLELRSSALGSASPSTARLAARGVDDAVVGLQAPVARVRPSAAALDRLAEPAVESEPRAAQIEQREGRFARVAAHASVARRPEARPSAQGQRVIAGATLAQAPVTEAPSAPAAGEAASVGAPRAAAQAAAPRVAARRAAARPSRVATAADWAARRLDIGAEVRGSTQAQPTAHRRPARLAPSAASAAVTERARAQGPAAALDRRPAASAPVAGGPVARGQVADGPAALAASAVAVRPRVASRADAPAGDRQPVAQRSAVEHVLDRGAIGAASPGSTLPQPTARAPRSVAVRQSVAPAPVFAQQPAAVAAEPAVGPLSGAAPSAAARSVVATGAAPRSVAPRPVGAAPSPRGPAVEGPAVRGRAEGPVASVAPLAESAPVAAPPRPAERALRRLTVAEAPAERSVVPAPAAAARLAAPAGARPLDRAAAPLSERASKAPRRVEDAVRDAVLARPVAAEVAQAPAASSAPVAPVEPARASVAAVARVDRAPALRAPVGDGSARAEQPAASRLDPAAAPRAAAERRIVRAVVHAAARVGLVLSAQTDLPTAVARLEAANARVERGERSVVPRPTARPERAVRSVGAPSAIFATPMSPAELQQAEPAPSSAQPAARSTTSAGVGSRPSASRPARRPAAARGALQRRASAAVHASDRSGRSPAVGRSVERSLSELSPTARAAVVSLLRRRSRPSALGYSRLVSGPSAPERRVVAGDRAVQAEAAGVEVQVRRQVERARPLDFAEVRTAQELSSPELSRTVRVSSTFRTPFGEVVVPGLSEGLRATEPGVRTGRHLTRSAEGRYMAPRMAAELGLVVQDRAQPAEATPLQAEPGAPVSRRASDFGAGSASVAARAPSRAGQRLSEPGPAAALRGPEGTFARAASAGDAPAPAARASAARSPATVGAHLPVPFAARPELGQVLGAVDQGHAERALPVWARRASGEPLARGTGGDFVQSLASARSEEDVVRVIVEQGGALSQVGSSLPKPVIQVIEHIRSEARAELEQRVDAARRPASSEGAALPEATRTRREARRGQTRDNVQVVKALTGLRSSGGARSNEGVGGDRVMKLARKLQQLIHLADGAGDRDAARRQVRMAEDSAQARSEGQGGAVAGNDAGATKQVDIEALGREVLEMVSRELEMRRERRQEDPDGRNVWW